jgi:hypothetical protein
MHTKDETEAVARALAIQSGDDSAHWTRWRVAATAAIDALDKWRESEPSGRRWMPDDV